MCQSLSPGGAYHPGRASSTRKPVFGSHAHIFGAGPRRPAARRRTRETRHAAPAGKTRGTEDHLSESALPVLPAILVLPVALHKFSIKVAMSGA